MRTNKLFNRKNRINRDTVSVYKSRFCIKHIVYIFIFAMSVFSTKSFSLGIPYRTPQIEGFQPLDAEIKADNPFMNPHFTVLKFKTNMFKDTSIIDFERRVITFKRIDIKSGTVIWEYHYPELVEYLKNMGKFTFSKEWNQVLTGKTGGKSNKKKTPKLQFELPVHYPEWARRVLGKEPPRLTIDGYQELLLSFESHETKKGGTTLPGSKSPGLGFDQNNSFTIRGSVGRLIGIEIKAGKNDGIEMSDPLKDFKIQYKEEEPGELEDEIIQEVTAGWTNFEMPGSGLTGYSESHEGLFGIKVRSQWGPLSLTTIASHEQGEVKRKKIPLGSSSGNRTVRTEKQYVRYKYFFLDSAYLNYYLGLRPSVPEVKSLKIYKKEERLQTNERTVYDKYVNASYGDEEIAPLFKLLIPDEDYYVNLKEGWIRFSDSVRLEEKDVIGIFLRTDDNSISKGDTSLIQSLLPKDSVLTNLWILKPESPDTSDSTYFLMWTNVYQIPPNSNSSDFEITINRIKSKEDTLQKPEGDNRYFSQILGIADERGQTKSSYSALNVNGKNGIFDFENGYMIIPPKIGDPLGNRPFANAELGEFNVNPQIYTVPPSNTDWGRLQPFYELSMTGTSKETTFNLGWGITNEKVLLNGITELIPNVDYTLDHESGVLDLISERAKDARDIEVEYQQESIFVFEKKAFLGMHGKLDMPFIGRNSYIASSVLYQNTTARDKLPRIGQEPFSKFLWGANAKIDFQPEWMTKAVNALPLISTNTPSSAVFDFEVAHSKMNPNTGGEAYIDDFEGSNLVYSLGVTNTSWYKASPPRDILDKTMNNGENLYYHPPAWQWYWYTPEGDDRKGSERQNVYKELKIDENDVRAGEDLYARTMRLVVKPVPAGPLKDRYKDPWAGIMTILPGGLRNREKDKYLEILVKNDYKGKLHIDMGNLSEDLSTNGGFPNGVLDWEDTLQRFDDRYDSTMDNGFDGRPDDEEYYLVPNSSFDGWDTLTKDDANLVPNDIRFKNDPARDNWLPYGSSKGYENNEEYVNGTQNDRYLTSEDINMDGTMRSAKREDFFRATIDFNDPEGCPFYERVSNANEDKGWRLFRIPLHNNPYMDSIGNPDLANIKFVRLWWTDFSEDLEKEHKMEFASIQFVGNQWQTVESGDTSKIEATVLNTEDNPAEIDGSSKNNPEAYSSPPPMLWELKEQGSNRLKKEQALRLKYKGLLPGEEALVERHFNYQNIDFSPYDEVRMFIKKQYVKDPSTWFVFRFGANDSTYYEYSCRVGALVGTWVTGLSINLSELSAFKRDEVEAKLENADSVNVVHSRQDGSRFRIYAATPVLPAFSDVKWMAFGFVRDKDGFDTDEGDILIDGLRVAGIKAESGWAFRGNFVSKWADLLDVTAKIQYEDADFRRMSDQSLGGGKSRLAAGLASTFSLDKFMSSRLGISIPINAGMDGEMIRPKLMPGSDVFLTDKNGHSDNFSDMAKDFAEMVSGRNLNSDTTMAEHFEQTQAHYSISSSYSKSATSKNPLVKLTAERLKLKASYTRDTSTKILGMIPSSNEDYFDSRSKRVWQGDLNYDLSPRNPPSWTKWKPFSKSKSKLLPKQFKRYEFTFLPTLIKFDFFNMNYGENENRNTKNNTQSYTRSFGLKHGFQFKFAPLKPVLDMSYNLSLDRDLNNAVEQLDNSVNKAWWKFTKQKVFQLDTTWRDYFITYGEKFRRQQASMRFSPQFIDWLTHNIDYSSEYNQYQQNRPNDFTNYLKTSVKSKFGFRSDFRIKSFFSDIADATDKIKALSSTFDVMEKGLGKISLSNFNFTYNATLDLNNEYLDTSFLNDRNIDPIDFLAYQLGKKDRSIGDIIRGTIDDENAFGGVRIARKNYLKRDYLKLYAGDERSTIQDWTIGTSLRLPTPLDLSLNPISFSWGRRYSEQPDTDYVDTTITFPDIKIGADTRMLEKISILSKYMKNMVLSSSYSYLRDSTTKQLNIVTKKVKTWSPLLSFRGTLRKWPINTAYNHNYSIGKETRYDKLYGKNNQDVMTSVNGENTEEVSHSNHWSINYTMRASKRKEIKILRWTVPIKGELVMELQADHKHSERKIGTKSQEDYVDMSLSPEVSYEFTENVQGKVLYSRRVRNDKYSRQEDIDNVFTLGVKIKF